MTTTTSPVFTAESITAQLSRNDASNKLFSGESNQAALSGLLDQWVAEFIMPALRDKQETVIVYRLPPALGFDNAQRMLSERGILIAHNETSPWQSILNTLKSGLTGKNYQGYTVSLKNSD